jgi:hypothetical protein
MAADRRRNTPRSSGLVALVGAPAPRPIEERGRVLYAEDVQELLASGGRRVSRWWVNHHFAPESCFKVGRANAWWEKDALAWLDSQGREAKRRSGT